ncbi:hypothetical protein NFI96_012575 [Prochilodus magdalenae]|nr:hypothetical protein NFI96_012575 [Prochilodus magdalenae]
MSLSFLSQVSCSLGLFLSPSFLSHFVPLSVFSLFSLSLFSELPTLLQSPPAIVLSQLNSTAKLHCSTTLKPSGLYLKQRYSKQRELLYLSIPDHTQTLSNGFEHRLSIEGKCCDFTLQLSQLQTEDTDGYFCEWVIIEGTNIQISYRRANETIIIVRDGDPEEECNKRRMVHHILFMISVGITVMMFLICIGLLIWRFRQSYQRYSPYKVRHSHPQPPCPHQRR